MLRCLQPLTTCRGGAGEPTRTPSRSCIKTGGTQLSCSPREVTARHALSTPSQNLASCERAIFLYCTICLKESLSTSIPNSPWPTCSDERDSSPCLPRLVDVFFVRFLVPAQSIQQSALAKVAQIGCPRKGCDVPLEIRVIEF